MSGSLGVGKAIVIDDAYGRPNRDDLQPFLDTLRQFITDNLSIKGWFDQQFGLSGDHKSGEYFDPLISSADLVQKFWVNRDGSPTGALLSNSVFPDLVKTINQRHAPLRHVESHLKKLGWEIRTYPQLPAKPEDVDSDVSLIVIDYVLNEGDPAVGIEASKAFVKDFLKHAKRDSKFSCPFVLLISELPEGEKHAGSFRSAIEIHGAFFQFAGKTTRGTVDGLDRTISAFLTQRAEQESYRKLHTRLLIVVRQAADKVIKNIEALELQDLATLHEGQLVQEGELLSEYLAWLYGQFFTADVMKDAALATQCSELPEDSFKVLLGHIPPTHNVQRLFSSISCIVPAVSSNQKEKVGSFELRFGDLFVSLPEAIDTAPASEMVDAHAPEAAPVHALAGGTLVRSVPIGAPDAVSETVAVLADIPSIVTASEKNAAKPSLMEAQVEAAHSDSIATPQIDLESPLYLLVISQTCDLIHRNITNGQVLCIDGKGHTVGDTEVDLLRATLRQMDNLGRILISIDGNYVQIDWSTRDLRTISIQDLREARGYRYLGRLNELYALEAQRVVLDNLGRIGVPIKPSYSVHFNKVILRFFKGLNEVPALRSSFDDRTVLAVLRTEKAKTSKHRLLISEKLKGWLIAELNRLHGAPQIAKQVNLLTEFAKLRSELEQTVDWSLIVTVKEEENVGKFSREKAEKTESLPNVFDVVLKEVFNSCNKNNPHLKIEFEKI